MTVQTATLVRVGPVEGWDVYRDDIGAAWVRDTDLGERAGLARPRFIRETIVKAVTDGALRDWRPHGGANNVGLFQAVTGVPPTNPGDYLRRHGGANEAYIQEVVETVTIAKGREQQVRVFYLNRLASIVILARLRTKVAEQAIAQAIMGAMRVFDAVERGVVALPRAVQQQPPPSLTEEHVRALIRAELRAHAAVLPAAPAVQAPVEEPPCGVDRWMRAVVGSVVSPPLQLAALLLIAHAGCHDPTCHHKDCTLLTLPSVDPPTVKAFYRSSGKPMRAWLDEFKERQLIKMHEEIPYYVFALRHDGWWPGEDSSGSTLKREESFRMLSRQIRARVDLEDVPNLARFVNTWGSEVRAWRPHVERRNAVVTVAPIPVAAPALVADVQEAPVSLEALPSLIKAERLYEALADRGFPHLRVKRAVKSLSEYLEVCSLEELIQEALALLTSKRV